MNLQHNTNIQPLNVSLNCPICLQSFSLNGGLHSTSALPCGHIFGKSCILEWLNRNNTICPVCRTSLSDMRKKISRSESYNNLIIDLHGCADNGLIEASLQSKEEVIKEYQEELKSSNDEIKRLKDLLENEQKRRRQSFSSRSNAFDYGSLTDNIPRIETPSTDNRAQNNMEVSNSSSNNLPRHTSFRVREFSERPTNGAEAESSFVSIDHIDSHRSIPSYLAYLQSRSDYGPPSNNLSENRVANRVTNSSQGNNSTVNHSPPIRQVNQTSSATRIFSNPNEIKFVLTQRYHGSFQDITDALYMDGIIIIGAKNDPGLYINKVHGIIITDCRNLIVFKALSKKKIISVKAVIDPLMNNLYKIIAICDEGKFYEMVFNKTTFELEAFSESLLSNPSNGVSFYKPSSLIWLSYYKYIIGTESGELFLKCFGGNEFKNINYVEGTSNDNNTLFNGPVKMLNKINEHAVVCYQSKRLCIYDDRCGRVAFKGVGDKVASIHFNRHSKNLSVLNEVSDNATALEVWQILDNCTSEDNINYSFKCVHREILNSFRRRSVELPSIAAHYRGREVNLIFCTTQYDDTLILESIMSLDCRMDDIPICLRLLNKVCLEEGKFYMNSMENIHFLVVQKNMVKLFELKLIEN
uniref:RING-type domain-containing protein n=1 Tax=Parastrongyloides trichosuri TaxID=131310 RepID=A0A0N5A0P6_PARTI